MTDLERQALQAIRQISEGRTPEVATFIDIHRTLDATHEQLHDALVSLYRSGAVRYHRLLNDHAFSIKK